MNNFWLSILERAINAVIKRIADKKGQFDRERVKKVFNLIQTVLDNFRKAFKNECAEAEAEAKAGESK